MEALPKVVKAEIKVAYADGSTATFIVEQPAKVEADLLKVEDLPTVFDDRVYRERQHFNLQLVFSGSPRITLKTTEPT